MHLPLSLPLIFLESLRHPAKYVNIWLNAGYTNLVGYYKTSLIQKVMFHTSYILFVAFLL